MIPIFVALLIQNDTNHARAMKIIDDYSNGIFLYSNPTKYGLMTVLSRKVDQHNVVLALESFENIFQDSFEFDTQLEMEIIDFYKKSSYKNQSFFDIACLVQAEKFGYTIPSC
jgi:hypothetical protein